MTWSTTEPHSPMTSSCWLCSLGKAHLLPCRKLSLLRSFPLSQTDLKCFKRGRYFQNASTHHHKWLCIEQRNITFRYKGSSYIHTNPVDVCRSWIREIIVYHAVDAFEIHTSSNHISGNQNPCFACSEMINRVFPLQHPMVNGFQSGYISLYFP